MNVVPLSAVPSAAGIIARWYYSEWGYMHPGETAENIEHDLLSQINNASMPQQFVAIDEQDAVVGAAELKFREVPSLPDFEHWLGGVYVVESCRGEGVGSLLVKHVQAVASDTYGVRDLYLQTEQEDGGLYARLGWQEIQRIYYETRLRVVMHKQLDRQLDWPA